MEDGCSEVRGGRLGRICSWNSKMELEDTCGEGRVCGSSDEDVEFGQGIVVCGSRRKEVVRRERFIVQGAMVGRQTAQCARVLGCVSGG